MKYIFFIITTFSLTLTSCKKNTVPAACNLTTDAFAGKYKITKRENVAYATGIATDQTSLLSECILSGIYDFKSDSTVTYTESDSCHADGIGTWSISLGNLNTDFSSGEGGRISSTHTESWDCTNLVVTTLFPNADYNYRFTLTRVLP